MLAGHALQIAAAQGVAEASALEHAKTMTDADKGVNRSAIRHALSVAEDTNTADRWRAASDLAGYAVELERTSRILRFRLWGTWQMALALRFRADLHAVFRMLDGGPPWAVLSDMRLFPAQSDEVAEVLGHLMEEAARHGMRKSAGICESRVTAMQVNRVASTTRATFSVHADEASAWRWLRK